MGSYIVRKYLAECRKCGGVGIVEEWDRDYRGIVPEFFCSVCDPKGFEESRDEHHVTDIPIVDDNGKVLGTVRGLDEQIKRKYGFSLGGCPLTSEELKKLGILLG